MIDFEIKEGKLVIKVENLEVPIFREIYEQDKSKDKEKALQQLLYVKHMASFKGPYSTLRESERNKKVAAHVFKNEDYIPSSLLKEAIRVFMELNIDSADRIFFEFDKQVDEICDRINKQKVTEDNTSKVVANMKDIEALMESRDKLRQRVEKMAIQSKSRGNIKLSFFEQKQLDAKQSDQ